MRLASLPGLLLFVTAAACGSSAAVEGDPIPLAQNNEQVRIKAEQVVLAKDALKGLEQPALTKLLREGVVSADTPGDLRTRLAAWVASGRATITDSATVTTPAGMSVLFKPSGSGKYPVLGGSVVPRVTEGRFVMELDLLYGPKTGRVHTGQTVRKTLSVADGGMVLIRFTGVKDPQKEHLVLLTPTRVTGE